MNSDTLTRGLLYLSLAVTGVPGNIVVICAFLSVVYHEGRLSPTESIVLHLASSNLMVVGVRCLLEVLATFEILNVFDDTGCKVVIFIYRTSRSLSIWLTFLLSVYQCLSVAPPGSRLAVARALFAQYLAVLFLALWLINTSTTAATLLYAVRAQNDSRLLQNGINVKFCILSFPSKLAMDANGGAQLGRDVVPISLMTTASLVLLVFLLRRRRRVKGLQGGAARQGPSAERRAALTVVTLVTIYVIIYGVDNGLWVYTLTVPKMLDSSLITDVRIFLSSLYAVLSPIVIIISNRKVNKQLNCGKDPKTFLDAAQPSDGQLQTK